MRTMQDGPEREGGDGVDIGATVQPAARRLIDTVGQVIVGRRDTVTLAVVALLCEGHIALEDIPGMGKTLLARTLARCLGGTFRRIQFTPDLLPSDVTGLNVYDQQRGRIPLSRRSALRPTSCSPTRSTARRRVRSPACWKPWRSGR